jgi:hypothetical protein
MRWIKFLDLETPPREFEYKYVIIGVVYGAGEDFMINLIGQSTRTAKQELRKGCKN